MYKVTNPVSNRSKTTDAGDCCFQTKLSYAINQAPENKHTSPHSTLTVTYHKVS